jgi:hypothetical protein
VANQHNDQGSDMQKSKEAAQKGGQQSQQGKSTGAGDDQNKVIGTQRHTSGVGSDDAHRGSGASSQDDDQKQHASGNQPRGGTGNKANDQQKGTEADHKGGHGPQGGR